MSVEKIDAALLSRMFLAGAHHLNEKKDWINELNVFPVPDGDTGTNMTMTIMSAVREIRAQEDHSMKALCKCISSGSLRGARGNSGVILSQLFRGFTKVVKGSDAIDIPMIAAGFEKAVETAYKAVIKPKEGTILTVAKGMAEVARKLADAQMSLEEYCRNILDYGNQVLQKTPELLPVLKEAGVVDSGGAGLMTILEGAYDALTGREIDLSFDDAESSEVKPEEETQPKERFPYCVELIIHADKVVPQEEVDEYHRFLASAGECVVLEVRGKEMSTHIHTADPGLVLTKAVAIGELTDVKVQNRSREKLTEKLFPDPAAKAKEQDEELRKKTEPAKPVGFVAVAAGDGFAEIFKGLGADYVISGGQTMNPSTEDVLNAVDSVNAENIFIFPNNKNIIMAAKQARELVVEKNVIVIETKTVPQGISAMLAYDPSQSVVDNQTAMKDAVGNVQTAEITYAIRDTKIGEDQIRQGDIMAVGDDGLLAVNKDLTSAALDAVGKMVTDDTELITLYYGQEYSEENANRLACEIRKKFPSPDVAVENGGQPVYYCIIAAE